MNALRSSRHLVFLSALLFTAVLKGHTPAASPTPVDELDEYSVVPESDPFEHLNRAIFRFNDGFYGHVLRPFTRVYERTVPKPARRGLVNFFDNIKFPVRFVSCVLQAKFVRAGRETEKFVINSTVGVAGLIRVSDSLPSLSTVPSEDLGQTFGCWGLPSGPYLVLPFLGPSSLRDAVGTVGDTYLDPVNWGRVSHTLKGFTPTWRYSLNAADFISISPDLLRTYDNFLQSAFDPYISVRNGYLQYRAAVVKK